MIYKMKPPHISNSTYRQAIVLLSLLLITCSSNAIAANVTFGNKALNLSIDKNGTLTEINSKKIDPQKTSPLFKVTLVENVYGLDAGKRRTIGLKPVARNSEKITLTPLNEPLPRITFKTIDKGQYFVLKLLSIENSQKEHAGVLTMESIPWIEWMPLDSVTKKSIRLGLRPHFYGVLQRKADIPLGSIAMWAPQNNEEFNEILYNVWVNENIPKPKVKGEWTIARAKQWVKDYHLANSTISSSMTIGPRKPEDLKPLVDQASAFGIKHVHMHLNSWADRYWPTSRDNLDVNTKIFPRGKKGMIEFSDYLESKGMNLTFRSVSYALGPQHPEYLGKVPDSRLASWWSGKLAKQTNPEDAEITVMEGREHLTEYDPHRKYDHVNQRDCMQIGNELIIFSGYTDNKDGTWTLKKCKRGYGNTKATAHKAGENARGLYRAYGVAFAPDPDSSMMYEMARRFAEFHNDTGAMLANFDAIEVHAMVFPYGTGKFMGEVYRYLDHPLYACTSGEDITWGYIETMFRNVKKKNISRPEYDLRYLPWMSEMSIGLHQKHWSASSPYAYAWTIPARATAGHAPAVNAQSGFHDITTELLNGHGLIDHYARVLNHWRKYGPKLPEEIKKRIITSGKPNPHASMTGFDRSCIIDETFRFEGDGDTLSVIPFQMMKREGIDRGWTSHNEHGTVYPYQYIKPGQSICVKNPYHAQVPEFIIRVMTDFDRKRDSAPMVENKETNEEKHANDMLDGFQAASNVSVEENSKHKRSSDQQSIPIELVAGKRYYIEALHKEADGGDNMAVAWKGPGIKQTLIDGKYLSPTSTSKTGKIIREWWTGIDGATVKDITSNSKYPHHPSGRDELKSFEVPENWSDHYAQRVSGYIYPPMTGTYTFYISSDDSSELRLSTDENSSNARVIAFVETWTPSREWPSGEDFSYVLLPDPTKIKNKGKTSFTREDLGVRVSYENDTDTTISHVSLRGDTLPYYSVNSNVTKAGGLGITVTGDASNAILVIRISGQGTRDYIVPLDFKGKRSLEIPSPQASWADARWPFLNAYKRWRGNMVNKVSLGFEKIQPHTSPSVVIEDIRFLPERPSLLNYPSIEVGKGKIQIIGRVPSERYLWYKGGSTVGMYDLNWNKLNDLPVLFIENPIASSGDVEIRVHDNNSKHNPWLETQFFVQDKNIVVGNKLE